MKEKIILVSLPRLFNLLTFKFADYGIQNH